MTNVSNKSLEGFGGWLILPLLGLAITPVRLSMFIYKDLLPIFTNGNWAILTTPGGSAYHSLWGPVLAGEVIGNSGSIILSAIALVFCLRHSRIAPKLVIVWLAFTLVFVITDFGLAAQIPAVAKLPNTEASIEVWRSIVGAAIWIPYFLMSKRVKATFIR